MDIHAKRGALIVGFLLLIFFIFFFSLRTADAPGGEITAPEDEARSGIGERMTIQHTFQEGVHEVFGTIELPTPCHDIETSVQVAESFPEQVTIALATVRSGDICAQVITTKEFSVTFEASSKAEVNLLFNGDQVTVPAL